MKAAGSRAVRDAAEVEIRCAYESVGAARRLFHPPEVTLIEEKFDEECVFRVAVLRTRLAAFTARLDEARLSHRID